MEVAVSASQGGLGPLLGKLNALLADECARLKGVRREIRSLRSELSNMHAALQKYTMLEDPDVQVKAWISEVRELAYDIEDCIDRFIHDLGNDGHPGGIKEFFRRSARRLKTLGSRRQIAFQIDELKARVSAAKDHRTSYKLDDIDCSTFGHPKVDPRLSALFTEEKHLVGIDGPRDDLAKWMVQKDEHHRVLSIFGFGGLGKTTLANEVYRTIKGQFHCHALVSVSQQPVLKKIIKDVISQVACEDGFTKEIDLWDEKKSIAKLREVLQDKRYLVIIDDIWSESAWNDIKCAFLDNNCSSRIIVTTRIFDVASSCCSGGDDHIYKMEPLNDIHSERLFYKRIFGSDDRCPGVLQEISNEILKKCGGLPLAIITISALLANKPPIKQEWEKVKRSIGCALGKKQSLDGMKSILFLGYSDLPHNLKTCLLYLSTFPEDYEIERESLVWRWIAEGFISEERGQNQEEVAESYFYDLINMSMVQPVDIGYDGKARACRVHDMMLELIISKAIEENFITVLSGQTVLPNLHGFIRRLSIQYNDQQLAAVLANTDLRHARSLSCFRSNKWMPRLVQFEALRVLYFESGDDLENIDKLFQLKYLSLRGAWLSNLPAGIVKLQYLETLDLRLTNVVELPTGFFRLTKLLRLLGNSRMKIPDRIGNMTNLQVLAGIVIYHSSTAAVEELGKLTCLRELDIYMGSADASNYKSHDDMLFAALCKLVSGKLQSLSILQYGGNFLQSLYHWSPPPCSLQRFSMSTSYYFPSTPKWIQPVLTRLVFLNINLRELREEDLHTLGELPALLFLELWLKPDPKERLTDPKERLTVQPIGFPGLKEFVLVFNGWEGGTYLTFVEGAMPKLVKLKLPFHVSMAKPHGFYLGIRHLPSLEEADVRLHDEGAENPDSKAAAVAIRNEANGHPNRPRVTIFGEGVHEDKEESHTEEVSEEENGTDGN